MRYLLSGKLCAIAVVLAMIPAYLMAETLQIMRGDASAAIAVTKDSTITLQSDVRIMDMVIANPSVADSSIRSVHEIALRGIANGRTTLTILHDADVEDVTMVEILVSSDPIAPATREPVVIPAMARPTSVPVLEGVASIVSIASSGAIILKTDLPYEEAATEDVTIAYTATLSARAVYVLGKKPGTTTLTLFRGKGRPKTTIQIEVRSNTDDVE